MLAYAVPITIAVAFVLTGGVIAYYVNPQLMKQVLKWFRIVIGILAIGAGTTSFGFFLSMYGFRAGALAVLFTTTLAGVFLIRPAPKRPRLVILVLGLILACLTGIPIQSFTRYSPPSSYCIVDVMDPDDTDSTFGCAIDAMSVDRRRDNRHSLVFNNGWQRMQELRESSDKSQKGTGQKHRLYVL